MYCVCAASDGSLWTPVIRPISVPVVSHRAPVPDSSVPRQITPLESRRAASLYSLPHGRSTMNGSAFVDGRRSVSNTAPHRGRPRSVENIHLRPDHLSPDHIPPQSAVLDHSARLSPYHRSLPRQHVTSSSTWNAPAQWSNEQQNDVALQQNDVAQLQDLERTRSLSADRRRYFPPLQHERSLRRDERGQQLENTRREVMLIYLFIYLFIYYIKQII